MSLLEWACIVGNYWELLPNGNYREIIGADKLRGLSIGRAMCIWVLNDETSVSTHCVFDLSLLTYANSLVQFGHPN